MPQYMNGTSNEVYCLSEFNFEIKSNIDCDILEANKLIYKNVLFPNSNLFNTQCEPNIKYLKELNIEIKDPQPSCPGYPDQSMDESCTVFFSLINQYPF
jgi:hypothetical protein